MAKEIQLQGSMVAIVDDDDYERLSANRWHAYRKHLHLSWYVQGNRGGPFAWQDMHRVVLSAPKGMMVDHKNGDGLDCRKENLRFATNRQNQLNSKPRVNNTSGYKGVMRQRRADGFTWIACVKDKETTERHHLGTFPTAEAAARAYDAKVKEWHGEFAWLNFPNE